MMTTTTTTDSGAKAATPSGARKKRGVRGDNQNNQGRRIDPAFIWMTVPAAAVFTVLLTIPLLTGFFYTFTNSKGYGTGTSSG